MLLQISRKWWHIEKILPLSSHRKPCMSFRFAYLHFTLAHSKGQIKVTYNFIANVVIDDNISNIILSSYKVVYGCSIDIFTFFLDPLWKSTSRRLSAFRLRISRKRWQMCELYNFHKYEFKHFYIMIFFAVVNLWPYFERISVVMVLLETMSWFQYSWSTNVESR